MRVIRWAWRACVVLAVISAVLLPSSDSLIRAMQIANLLGYGLYGAWRASA